MAQINLCSWADDFVNEVGDGGVMKFEENVNNVDRLLEILPDVLMILKNQVTIRAVVGMMGLAQVNSSTALRPYAVSHLLRVGEPVPQTERRKAKVPPEV